MAASGRPRSVRNPVAAGNELIDALDRRDAAAVENLLGPTRVANLRDRHRWTAAHYIEKDWHPTLTQLAGSPRRITSVERLPQEGEPPEAWPVRLVIAGPRGHAYFALRSFDESGLGSFGVEREVCNGIGTIYVHCPQDRRPEVARFYAELLRRPLSPRGTRIAVAHLPSVVIGRAQPGEPMPRWPDPAYPQQMHLDVFVADVARAGEDAETAGATLLDASGPRRTYADPVGHPFCLYPSAGVEPAIGRLVIDCPDPRVLARFYGELLDMPTCLEHGDERVVIAASDGRLPHLVFQHVERYIPPRWGDHHFPQQLHCDLSFDDAPASKQRVERLGAERLRPLGGTCPVYSDPAGHPFCLCHVD